MQICVTHIRSSDWYSIHIIVREQYPYAFPRYNACIAQGFRIWSSMAIFDPPSLTGEVHFYIKMMCLLAFLYPGGGGSLSSRILKSIPTFEIALFRAFMQNVFLFSLSILFTLSTEVGISIPYLCKDLQTQEFNAVITLSLLRRVKGSHQANNGSS